MSLEDSGIYEIVNTINGKRYVGSAKCFRVRWNGHRTALNKGRHHSKHLQAAWIKYGSDAFEFRIIEFCDAPDLISREQAVIDWKSPEYNSCPKAGSTLGRLHSEETRQKIRARASGRKLPPRPPEWRAALSAALAGKQKSEAHAAALQAGRASRVFTDDQRAAISARLKAEYAAGIRVREKSEQHRQKIGKFYAKLTDDQVREIRALRKAGVACKEIAARFGSNAGTVCEIANRKRYRWVDP